MQPMLGGQLCPVPARGFWGDWSVGAGLFEVHWWSSREAPTPITLSLVLLGAGLSPWPGRQPLTSSGFPVPGE